MDYKSSVEIKNAPYRGISSRKDAVDMELGIQHDLFQIQKISGGNPNFIGHKNEIVQNLTAIYFGGNPSRSSYPTSGSINTVKEHLNQFDDLKEWTSVRQTTVNFENNVFKIDNNGLLATAGILSVYPANVGDFIQIRFKIKKGFGEKVKIAVGALGIDSGKDDLTIYDLNEFNTGQYVIKRLCCKSRQDIQLVLYSAYETASGVPSRLFIEDFSVSLLNQTDVGVVGTDNVLKQGLETEKLRLGFLNKCIENPTEGGNNV